MLTGNLYLTSLKKTTSLMLKKKITG